MLVREEDVTKLLVYYESTTFLLVESWYTDMEKLAYSLMITSRKLRHYFQAYSIWVLTNLPLKQVL